MDIHGVAPLLQVFDMPTSLRFYRDILGFAIWDRSGPEDDCGWCGLRLHGAEVMLNTAYEAEHRPAAPDAALISAHHDTSLFFRCEDLEAAYRHLRDHGVEVEPPNVASYGVKQLWFKDPDGYGLCFQWPTTKEGQERWRERFGMAKS